MSSVTRGASQNLQTNLASHVARIRWPICVAGLLVASVGTGIAVNESAQDMRTLYQDLGQAQVQQDALQEEHSRLLLEKSAYSSLPQVEKIARTELNMVFPERMDEVSP